MCVHTSGMYTLKLARAVCPVINPAEDIDFLFMGIHKWIHRAVSLSAPKTHTVLLTHPVHYLTRYNPKCITVRMICCIGTSRVQSI